MSWRNMLLSTLNQKAVSNVALRLSPPLSFTLALSFVFFHDMFFVFVFFLCVCFCVRVRVRVRLLFLYDFCLNTSLGLNRSLSLSVSRQFQMGLKANGFDGRAWTMLPCTIFSLLVQMARLEICRHFHAKYHTKAWPRTYNCRARIFRHCTSLHHDG